MTAVPAKILNFIGGEFSGAASGRRLDDIDPAVGKPYCHLPDSDSRDAEQAVRAAAKAFPAWAATPAAERSRLLLKIADLIEKNLESLAMAECVDTGKPLSLARGMDIPRAAANFRFFATAVLHWRSEAHATDAAALNYTLRQPRGVAGLISPWNLPLYLLSWKIAPALATGNTAVAKPSELAPMTAHRLALLCREAGLPPGVLNIVHGLGSKVGAAIVSHPAVPAISFTGGTVTGAEIARSAGPLFKKLSLELGGKNPNIVFADADMDEAIPASLRSAFTNQGQVCLSGSRILVERRVYPEFLRRLTAMVRKVRLGDPRSADTEQGALISEGHLNKVRSYLELARKEGGKIVCGGSAVALKGRCRGGYFHQPTIVTGLAPNSRVNQEEIFGPVATVTPFSSDQEAVSLANSTAFGLAASVWTRDLKRAHRVAERLESGTVWVNCWLLRDLRVPFGGVKSSGVGREGGEEALRFFTEAKNVCVKVGS